MKKIITHVMAVTQKKRARKNREGTFLGRGTEKQEREVCILTGHGILQVIKRC